VQKVSQASATQRAGRAGRLRAGRCVRLYTQHDHDTRPRFETPEIQRADLAETVLALRALDAGGLDWLEAPAPAALAAAETLLARLGAVGAGGKITAVGRRMLRFPVHPRLARVMIEAETRGVVEEASAFAAVLGERDAGGPGRPVSGRSDVIEAVERLPRGDRARRQLARLARAERARGSEDDLLIAVLTGFPDRVARRRSPGSNELLLSAGGSAELSPASVVREPQLMVAVDVEERQAGISRRTVVRMASAIEPEWLIDAVPDALIEEREAVWDAAGERVEIAARLRYDALILDEKRTRPAPEDAEPAAAVLAKAARAAGIGKFVDAEAWERWRARLAFVARAFPEAGLALPDEEAAIALACQGATSFADLRAAGLVDRLRTALTGQQARLVAEMAPERVGLMAGRQVKVEYDQEKPWIQSRLQDFFGMTRGPAVGGGRVPLVLHLLAPNQRAVQVTSDLAGFWERHYPAIRRELMRRYPRHKWPEDPLA
jgi:ATP-dependent helicase HrpB